MNNAVAVKLHGERILILSRNRDFFYILSLWESETQIQVLKIEILNDCPLYISKVPFLILCE